MAKDNNELSAKLTAQGAKMTPLALKDEAKNWFEKNQHAVGQLMGGPTEARRLFLAVMNTVSRSPKLLECDKGSIFKALLQCAELKLYPGPLQEAALVPFWNSKRDCFEAQFMPQYQGLVKLSYNAGFIRRIVCRVVFANEEFEYCCGSREVLTHKPIWDEEARGERVGVYCVIRTKYGEEQITYLPASFIERTQKRSKGGSRSDSPWNSTNPDDVDWMWKKTALKQALKLIPKSAELARALELDNEIEAPELKKPQVVDLGLNDDEDDNGQENGNEGQACKEAL